MSRDISNTKKITKVIIAASGTGGHLFPARIIAEELKNNIENLEILFIGAGRPLEKKLIDDFGFNRKVVEIVGIRNLGIKGFLKFLKMLPKAIFQMIKIFKEYKPNIVIGVGGYVSFLPVLIGRLKGVPTFIYELDLSPGISNKVLSKIANVVMVAFPNCELRKSKKAVYTGHTLKKGLLELRDFKIRDEIKNILILGGSQGAKKLDETVLELIPFFKENNFIIYHQCRKESLEDIKEEYKKLDFKGKIVGFIDDMVEAYKFADIIISRAGASSVMEVLAVNKPAIFIPLPGAGNHQLPNAMFLADANKAFIVKQDDEEFIEKLKDIIIKLSNKEYYEKIVNTKFSGVILDGSSKIKDEVLKFIDK
ncbi:MAG: undecaprenyldiphospho-muramoylpentapeptide beta-N-acetylglucosaminyltransferase [Bdellovibrionota bacterium]